MNPILELRQVSKLYAGENERVLALDRVSLSVRPGEFLALMGKSGCGKSTLLNLAGAMDVPTSGEVLLEERNITALNDEQLTAVRRDKVGFIFQSFQLLQTLSVVENVELPLLLSSRSEARLRATESLDSVGLAGYEQRLPHQLSGGQMQRVAIARAMIHAPRLLLADEPTGNLDSQTGADILELLRRVASDHKMAVLMATHSAESAAIADGVVKMRDGRIEGISG